MNECEIDNLSTASKVLLKKSLSVDLFDNKEKDNLRKRIVDVHNNNVLVFKSIMNKHKTVNVAILLMSFCIFIVSSWCSGLIFLISTYVLSKFYKKKKASQLFLKLHQQLESERELIKNELLESIRKINKFSDIVDDIESAHHLHNVLENDKEGWFEAVLGDSVYVKWREISIEFMKKEIVVDYLITKLVVQWTFFTHRHRPLIKKLKRRVQQFFFYDGDNI